MSTSHKFKNLDDLAAVFPEVPWQADAGGGVSIFDAKAESYVPVTKGQFVVSIGDRYEVADEEPEKAKPAEAPKAEKKAASKADEPKAPKAEAEEKPADEKSTGIESAIPVAS